MKFFIACAIFVLLAALASAQALKIMPGYVWYPAVFAAGLFCGSLKVR